MRFVVLALLAGLLVGCGGKPPVVEIRNMQWTSERKHEYDYGSESLEKIWKTYQKGKAQVVCDGFKGRHVQVQLKSKLETEQKTQNYPRMVELKDGIGELEMEIMGEKEPKAEFSADGYFEMKPFEVVVK